jgi:hypothetical protein
MSSTATAAPWTANQTDTAGPAELQVELVTGETITIPTATWDADTIVLGIYREGFLRVRSAIGATIRYIPGSQIKEIVPAGGKQQ